MSEVEVAPQLSEQLSEPLSEALPAPSEGAAPPDKAEEGASEWGWDHTPIEPEDGYERQPIPLRLDGSSHPKEEPQTPTKAVAKKDPPHTVGLSKGMTSSPSFLELERAIGQTLALGLNSSESNNSLNSNDQRGYPQRTQINRSRSFGKQQQIFRPYSNSNLMSMNLVTSARVELDPFSAEYESRALILFHNPNLNPLTVRNIAQKCGVLYYIRPEFHTRYGVTLLSYFDLRAATHAQNSLAIELGAEGNASAHFSVMLHAGSGSNSEESRLILRNVSSECSEAELQSRFSQFGELRSIQKVFDEGGSDGADTCSFAIEYFNVQDSRLANSELSATISQVWGAGAEIAFAPLDARKQTLCRQLLATLSRWRAELAAASAYVQPPMGTSYPSLYPENRGMPYYQPPPQSSYMPAQMMYSQAPEYHAHPVPMQSHEQPFYASNNMAYQSDRMYPTWQQSAPMAPMAPMPPKASAPVPHPSLLQPSKMSPHSAYSPAHESRPLHHNGGHGYNRNKAKTTQGGAADSEFALDLKEMSGEHEPVDRRTTLMIRNIPNKYSQAMLLEEINVSHEGRYDFFYLPIDFKNRCNVGYAFISFLEPSGVGPFVREFEGLRWSNFNSDKVCSISYARIQGKAAMISRFQNSSLLEKDDEYRPLLFYSDGPLKGKPEPFPAANRNRSASYSQRQQSYEGDTAETHPY